MFAYQRAAGI